MKIYKKNLSEQQSLGMKNLAEKMGMEPNGLLWSAVQKFLPQKNEENLTSKGKEWNKK